MKRVPAAIGRYEVTERLGGGGMGSVFLAVDPAIGRQVAIKLLNDDLSDNPQLHERFVREARTPPACTTRTSWPSTTSANTKAACSS